MTAELLNTSLQLSVPELMLAVGAMVLLMIGVFTGERSVTIVSGLAVALLIMSGLWLVLFTDNGAAYGGAFLSDPFARFMKVLALIGSITAMVMSVGHARAERIDKFEYPVLLVIATLGMMVSARGVAKWWTAGQPVSFPTESYAEIGAGMMPVVIFILLAMLFHLLLRYTVYGKHTYAIGSNEAAARMSGIKVARHKVLVYTIAGLLAGVAALVLSSKNLTAQAGMGTMYELDAIAMAVIGGVSLSGGRGSIPGTVLGALIFGVIISGFTFLRLDAYYQEMVKGAIIVGAVVLDQWRQRRSAARR